MKQRTIFHVDCNSFFASVSLLYKPWLRERPVAVGGDVEKRHGIVLAKNEPAKKYGVKTGMALWEARQLCPDICFIPPEYDRYDAFSRDIKAYLAEYSDLQESFGADESWLDVTGSLSLFGGREALAERLRRGIARQFGVTVSIGVSWNKIYAKLGSDLKKPNAITYITREDEADTRWQEAIYPLPVEELLYVGRATKARLNAKYVFTIGQLAAVPEKHLAEWFGVIGRALHAFATGDDLSPVSSEGAAPVVKSFGNSSTTPRDLRYNHEVKQLIHVLAENTGRRMREHGFKANTIEVWIRDNGLTSFSRQRKLERATGLDTELAHAAYALFLENYNLEHQSPIRTMGIRASGLVLDTEPWQCRLGEDAARQVRKERLDAAMDGVNRRYGKTCLRHAIALADDTLAGMGTKPSQDFAPVGYFR